MKIFYSPSLNGFLLEKTSGDYQNDDLIEVSENTYAEFIAGRSDKIMKPGSNGPVWDDIPPLTNEQLIAQEEKQKSSLIAEASTIIAPLADAQAGGYIDDADVPRLTAWQKYRYALTKVDTSTAPDITWPEKPA